MLERKHHNNSMISSIKGYKNIISIKKITKSSETNNAIPVDSILMYQIKICIETDLYPIHINRYNIKQIYKGAIIVYDVIL